MHIVQSPIWEKFKASFGTETVRVGEVFYSKHKIPFTNYYYAYCPKVDPFVVDFVAVHASLKENNCVAINFDVPNVLADSARSAEAQKVFEKNGCAKSPKSTFTPHNLLLDLTISEEELLQKMHSKHRYNIRYAQKNGVEVREGTTSQDFDVFYELALGTANRQGFYIHPKSYYEKIWEILGAEKFAKILTAYYQEKPLASWMFFVYDKVFYYPYGGSSEESKNLFASNLVGWEGIKLGKSLGCETFDMWGACADPDDSSDPEWGFTNFKMKFGAKYVGYIPSYDLILNPVLYKMFNLSNNLRWKILKLRKRFF